MTQTIQAADVTLEDLEEKFGLQRVRDAHFFPEWMNGTDQITSAERATLDRVQTKFLT